MLTTRDESVSRMSGIMRNMSRMRPMRSAGFGMSVGGSASTAGFGRSSHACTSVSSCSAARTASK